MAKKRVVKKIKKLVKKGKKLAKKVWCDEMTQQYLMQQKKLAKSTLKKAIKRVKKDINKRYS